VQKLLQNSASNYCKIAHQIIAKWRIKLLQNIASNYCKIAHQIIAK
jgi:RNase P subunit RPR2